MGKIVGIDGGAGAIGSHLAELYQSSGFKVAIADIDTEKAKILCQERGYTHLHTEELVSKSNLLIFSLPIDITPKEIKRLVPGSKCEAYVEVASNKTKSMEALVEHAWSEAELWSIHNMYRPDLSPWGQNVLFISERPKDGGSWFKITKGIFKKNNANIDDILSIAEHDKEMIPLQEIPQASMYAFLLALREFVSEISLERLDRHSTFLFRNLINTAGRLVARPDNGRMYGLIQKENPYTENAYDILFNALTTVRNNSKDPEAFDKMHEELHYFLGEYNKVVEERTKKSEGRPMGVQIVYESKNTEILENTLGTFRKKPEKYKEQLETTWILVGDLSKLKRSENIILAQQAFYKSDECDAEGNFGFYVKNKNDPTGKKIRFSPIIPHDLGKALKSQPHYLRIQMFNKFKDQFLNLFNTWKRTPDLHNLGELVAYRT